MKKKIGVTELLIELNPYEDIATVTSTILDKKYF